MTRTPRYLLATALLAAAVAPAVPAQARVSAAGPAAAAPRALAATATADVYEAGAGDDTSATARAIALPGYGAGVMYEAHTFDVADAVTGDEDWISFTVTDAEADAGYVVMIEASADTPGVRPVVEVYAPGAAPTAPTALDGVTDPAAAAASQVAPWLVRGGATLEFRPSSALPGDSATYRARIRPAFAAGTGFGDAAGAYRLRAKFGMTTRLAGPDRHATAARISFERFADGSLDGSAAVVVNGLAFPDAMAGATLAGALGCPLLTTDPKALSASTRTELRRLGVDTVYLLGGTGAVTPAVQTALAGMGLSVRRIAGLDRFATAAAIARAADASAAAGTAPLAFVASGRAFPDALSASAVAAHSAAPVLLTEPGRLATATAEALADPALGITDVVS
ncbi:MAG: cell wall-binding repeat-containing protein, partial [Actinobacteria bacterium]